MAKVVMLRPRIYLPVVRYNYDSLAALFADDFTNDRDKGWAPVVGSWEIADEEYRLYSRDGEDEYSFIRNEYWSNYTIQVDVMYTHGALTNDYGIAFYVSEDYSSLYKLVINGNDDVRLLYVTDRVRDARREIASADSPVSFQPGERYTLQAVTQDGRIQCFVNGQKVIDIQDSSRSRGLIGLTSDGFPALLHYDNVTVY